MRGIWRAQPSTYPRFRGQKRASGARSAQKRVSLRLPILTFSPQNRVGDPKTLDSQEKQAAQSVRNYKFLEKRLS
jgi:hypothetical protein